MSRLFIATNGLSVWTSADRGETLRRTTTEEGIYTGSRVWGMALHPNHREMLIGTELGLFRYTSETRRYTPVPSPMDGRQVTAIAYSPHDPDLIIAGCQPAALFRSEDGGKSWQAIETGMHASVALRFIGGDSTGGARAEVRPTTGDDPIKHWTRVCQIVFDPQDPDFVCAGVEIDDAWISRDRGRTWTRSGAGLVIGDVHGMSISHHDGRVLFATTAGGLHVSRDDGASWQLQRIDSPWQYTRSIVRRPDRTGTMYLTNGGGAPGWEGRLYRSRDFGATWEDCHLPDVESSVYFLAVNEADPMLAYAATALGQFYRSDDGGETWLKLPKRLGEVRAIAWMPD